MADDNVIIIGAGVGGLAAAIELARQGTAVTVLERAAQPGGKARVTPIDDVTIDAGPTVLTMRHVFEQLFADAGSSLSDHLNLRPLDILARHAWNERDQLDLFADRERAGDAIGRFAGRAAARGYHRFSARAQSVFNTLDQSFMHSATPSISSLIGNAGMRGLSSLWQIKPFTTLWSELGEYFEDPRLRQLFGRYATYCGSSPFLAPATLMLIAHVESQGVWAVEGGIQRLALSLATLAESLGVTFRYDAHVDEITLAHDRASGVMLANGEWLGASAIIANGDVAALSTGLFGTAAAVATPPVPRDERSLSAVTWALVAKTSGFALSHHNVFFSADYKAEFDAIFRHSTMPANPTIYVCAQDRDGSSDADISQPERLLCLVNAPPNGDSHTDMDPAIAQCEQQTFAFLERCGLQIERAPERMVMTNPKMFNALYPATGGALYGQATHGWKASFARPTAQSQIPGLYLAGGSTHPGAGMPMAALSGRMAAARLLQDRASTRPSRTTVMRGGISTR